MYQHALSKKKGITAISDWVCGIIVMIVDEAEAEADDG